MATPLPPRTAFLTPSNRPTRCPHCGSTRLIRKGTRRKKLEIVQLWQCKLCRRVFTPAPPELRYKTYPLRIILDGVTLYNLGYSLAAGGREDQRQARIQDRAIHTRKLDDRASRTDDLPPPARPSDRTSSRRRKPSARRKLYHRQVYSFAYHRPKLALLRENSQHRRFAPLADFLEQRAEHLPARSLPATARAHRSFPIS